MSALPANEADAEVVSGLVRGIAEGDRKAFERFYTLTIQGVLRITTGVLRDRAQAEEVAQEVYLELWRRAPQLDPRRPVEHLLRQMARRRAIDRVRAVQATRERDHQYATRDHRPAYDDTAEQGEIRLAFAPVADAIQQLPAIHRDVLFLAYIRGYSHSDIARALNIPLGTVKTRLRDTLIRLHSQLVPNPEDTAATEWRGRGRRRHV